MNAPDQLILNELALLISATTKAAHAQGGNKKWNLSERNAIKRLLKHLGISYTEELINQIVEGMVNPRRQGKTILATIVGQRPATVPPEIGVFVVEQGKLT